MNYGITLEKINLDVTLIQYLLEASDSSKPISEILSEYTELSFPDGIEKEGQLDFNSQEEQLNEAVANAKSISKLLGPLNELINQKNLNKLNSDVELPLVSVLAEMENRGIAVDVKELKRLRD